MKVWGRCREFRRTVWQMASLVFPSSAGQTRYNRATPIEHFFCGPIHLMAMKRHHAQPGNGTKNTRGFADHFLGEPDVTFTPIISPELIKKWGTAGKTADTDATKTLKKRHKENRGRTTTSKLHLGRVVAPLLPLRWRLVVEVFCHAALVVLEGRVRPTCQQQVDDRLRAKTKTK